MRNFFVFGDILDDFLLTHFFHFDFFGNFDLDFFLGARVVIKILTDTKRVTCTG